jgi:MFS family permease
MTTIVNSTMGSSLPSMAIPYIMDEFSVTDTKQSFLPISVFLIGYIFGPIIWAPMSEQYGRRLLSQVTFAFFCVWTLSCAVAPNWTALLIFRLLVGIFASSPVSVVTGILADIYSDAKARGRAMAFFMAVGTMCATF